MADQISIQHSAAAANIYAIIRDADGAVWNGSSFEAYLTANLGNYDVALTEQGTASRYYTAAMPSVSAGRYSITAFVRAGGSPAETDTCIGDADAEWDGTRFTRLGAPAGTSIAADLLTIDNLVDDLEGRLTSTRAGYLDNLSAGAVATASALSTVSGLVDDLESRLGTPSNLGSGATVAANLVDIEAQTDDIGTAGAGLTAVPWNAAWDAEVQSEATDALNAYDPPTKAELDSAVSPLALQTSVDDLESRLGTPSNLGSGATIAANLVDIEAQTDDIGAAGAGLTAVPWNASWDAEVQSEVQDALDATIADSVPSDGTRPSISQALYMLTQFMLERNVSGTTVTVKKPDGSTSLFTLTLNDGTSPTSITRAS